MVELLDKPAGFERIVSDDSAFHADIRLLRHLAWERWIATGFPTTRDEEWKYTPLKEASERAWKSAPAGHADISDLDAYRFGPSIVLLNGRVAPHLSDLSGLPSGVTVSSIRESAPSPGLGSIASLEGRLGSTNDERFTHLNTALFEDGVVIRAARGVRSDEPISIIHAQTGADGLAVHPRTLVLVEEDAGLKLVESYVGLSGAFFTNAVTEILVGRHGSVEHVRDQRETRATYHIGLVSAHQEADSSFTSYSTQFGGRIGRLDVNLWLNGEHTESRLDGVYVGTGGQILDNKTRIDHAKPNCHSFEAYKGILADRATGVFNGKIFVYEDAQKTDAKQTNQALLLSPHATINTKPQLEIFADDVKCTHGATVGQIRADALFYLRARGIPERQARGLLVYAFAADVLERITMEPVRAALERELHRKLHEETDLTTSHESPLADASVPTGAAPLE